MSEVLLPSPVHLVCLAWLLVAWALRSRWGRTTRVLLVAFACWATVLSLPLTANLVQSYLEGCFPRPRSVERDEEAVILVLSAGHSRHRGGAWEARLSASGWERASAGVRLWRTVGGVLVFTGGPTPDGRTSVAETMAELASGMGVPPAAVEVERRSTTTYENFLFSAPLVRGRRGWVVTSALHMPRAMAASRRMGLDLRAYPCDYPTRVTGIRVLVPNSRSCLDLSASAHEILGLLYYRLRGWA